MSDFSLNGRIKKVNEEERLVFGFFNITKIGEEVVVDQQDDKIESSDLEKASYEFVLNYRDAGEVHFRTGVGDLVESVFITKEKQELMQQTLQDMGIEANIDFGCECWWGGFHVTDDSVWKRVKSGDYAMFSIGGTGTRIKENQ